MLLRIWRMRTAASAVPRTKAGMSMRCRLASGLSQRGTNPEAGSQPSRTEKNRISMILFFSVRLGWLPASGFVPLWESPLANLQRMLMPAFVLGTALAAVLMRQIRNSMIEVLSADYIRTARAKGLPGRAVVFRHAIRNGLIPVVTILGLQMGALMGGAVVTEQIFVVPGFGRLIVEAVFTRDYPLVQGV